MNTSKKNLIVFDMDGVIVDVSRSYRETVRQTARLFFKGAPNWQDLPDPLFSLKDLAQLKQRGGLNNDWELTYRVLTLLISLVKPTTLVSDETAWEYHHGLINRCNLDALIECLTTRSAPLDFLYANAGDYLSEQIQTLSSHDVGSGNVIKQIFQEIYLGQDLFKRTYNLPAKINQGVGLIDQESLLIEIDFFNQLSKVNLLAIATGRPAAEAEYALDKFKIRSYFSMMLSLDDCLREENLLVKETSDRISLSKPHPFMLNRIADMYSEIISKCYYIGDMPDDMQAASRSNHGYAGIGFVASAADKSSLIPALENAGASHIIHDISQLQSII